MKATDRFNHKILGLNPGSKFTLDKLNSLD